MRLLQLLALCAIAWPMLLAPGCSTHPTIDAARDAPRDRKPNPGLETVDESRFSLFVLGIAQDGAVPHLGCEKPCCVAARRDPRRRRYPASLGIHDRETGALLLIEATPAVEAQVGLLHRLSESTDRGRKPVDGILLTHAHIGHYLGLAHFGREVAATRGTPVHVSPRFATFLRSHGPWRQLDQLGQIRLTEFAMRTPFTPLPGLEVTAIPVPHRDEFSDTVAYRIRGPNQTVLFVPDIDRWDVAGGLLDELLDDADIAYLDGTFYDGRELPERIRAEIPHPPIVDTMRRLQSQARRSPGAIRFLHLNHTNPALWDETLRAEIRARGFDLAERGERIDL